MEPILAAASLMWNYHTDAQGKFKPGTKTMLLAVDFYSNPIDGKRCGFSHMDSELFVNQLRENEPLARGWLMTMVGQFVLAAGKSCYPLGATEWDVEQMAAELGPTLWDGLAKFMRDGNWTHIFANVLPVLKGEQYRDDFGRWVTADKNTVIVIKA